MDFLLLMKVCFCSACIGWAYVVKLTDARQLFDFVQKGYHYLPKRIMMALYCPHCVGGWVSMIMVALLSNWAFDIGLLLDNVIWLIIAPCVTMVLVSAILRLND